MGRIFLYFPYFYGRADDIKAQVAIIFEMTAQCCTRIVGSDIMYFAIFQMTGGEYVDICGGNVGGICGNHGNTVKARRKEYRFGFGNGYTYVRGRRRGVGGTLYPYLRHDLHGGIYMISACEGGVGR